MAIRRTYQFNTPSSLLKNGILLNNTCDIHGRLIGSGYDSVPYCLDLSQNDRLIAGDRSGLNSDSLSLPFEIAGGLHVNGRIVSSSSVTITADDFAVLLNNSGNAQTVNLPALADTPNKLLFVKILSGDYNVTFDPSGSETIDGESTWICSADTNIQKAFWLFGESSTEWKILNLYPNAFNLLVDYSPSYSTTSGTFSTIATSSSVFFPGRKVMFFIMGRGKSSASSFLQAEFAVRIDGSGTDFAFAQWTDNYSDTHAGFSGCVMLDGSDIARGNHTVDLRGRRVTGTPTFSMDSNDYYQLRCIML